MIRDFDVAVIGGSLGGVQAARAACGQGMRVYLCEETDWIGGQLTSQAVPPDEHRWIESQGATQTYLSYRKKVRDAYLADPEASTLLRSQTVFCPGNSWVSRVAHAPSLAHQLLTESLAPYVKNGLLTIALNTRCVEAEVRDDRVMAAITEDASGNREKITARLFLDATDTGELLPLTGTEYRIGAESREETGEPRAAEQADPGDQQPITWVAALELSRDPEPMRKPDRYEEFLKTRKLDSYLLAWKQGGAGGQRFAMFDHTPGAVDLGLWSYRRIQYAPYYRDGRPDITLLNWPQNDYPLGNIVDDPQAQEHLEGARELTRCCVYWLRQQGYPVQLRGDVLGTEDGLAKAPYIRESRRIVARQTILEQEVAEATNSKPRIRPDSVGVGHYAIDVHHTTHTQTTFYAPAQPFEIPLHALIPIRMRNLLPACKNIGTTHVTGGCFRLHPVEWTIGEAAGYLAAFCIHHNLDPAEAADLYTADFQHLLCENGFQLHWHDLNP